MCLLLFLPKTRNDELHANMKSFIYVLVADAAEWQLQA